MASAERRVNKVTNTRRSLNILRLGRFVFFSHGNRVLDFASTINFVYNKTAGLRARCQQCVHCTHARLLRMSKNRHWRAELPKTNQHKKELSAVE